MKIRLLVNNHINGFEAGCREPNYRIAIKREFIDPQTTEPECGFVIVACDLNPIIQNRTDIHLSGFFETEVKARSAWEKGFETQDADVPREVRPARRHLLSHLQLAGFTTRG